MVTTVSRVLAAVLTVLLAVGQLPSAPRPKAWSGPVPATAVAVAKPWPHAVVQPAGDSTTVSLALAKWHGKQAHPRDLPDGYVPPPVAVRILGDAWLLSSLPLNLSPGPGAHVGLPPGRAPPPTTLG